MGGKGQAKLDTKDPKKIVIRELPFGSTTESLIKSIEQRPGRTDSRSLAYPILRQRMSR
jgi:DNA gyrase/topoisomerase IV subunit A